MLYFLIDFRRKESASINYFTFKSVSWMLSRELFSIFFDKQYFSVYLAMHCIRLWQVLKWEGKPDKEKLLPKFTYTIYSVKEQILFLVLLVEKKQRVLSKITLWNENICIQLLFLLSSAGLRKYNVFHTRADLIEVVQIFFDLYTFLRKKLRE